MAGQCHSTLVKWLGFLVGGLHIWRPQFVFDPSPTPLSAKSTTWAYDNAYLGDILHHPPSLNASTIQLGSIMHIKNLDLTIMYYQSASQVIHIRCWMWMSYMDASLEVRPKRTLKRGIPLCVPQSTGPAISGLWYSCTGWATTATTGWGDSRPSLHWGTSRWEQVHES